MEKTDQTWEDLTVEIKKTIEENQQLKLEVAKKDVVINGLLSGINNGDALQNAMKFLNGFNWQLQDVSLTASVIVKLLIDKGVFTMEEFQTEGSTQYENNKKQEEKETK